MFPTFSLVVQSKRTYLLASCVYSGFIEAFQLNVGKDVAAQPYSVKMIYF